MDVSSYANGWEPVNRLSRAPAVLQRRLTSILWPAEIGNRCLEQLSAENL